MTNQTAHFLSGFCNPANDAASHRRCRGEYDDALCRCECHETPAGGGAPGQGSAGSEPTTPPAGPAPIAPGLYTDMDEETYHRDKTSLSASGAKLLLPPSCPAKFRYRIDNPITKDTFDLGHVVHRLVLGRGAEIVEVKADSWRTNDAKAAKAKAHKESKTPLLTADLDTAKEMAAAVLAHPVAGALFTEGRAEVSAFFQDPETGIMRRARFDWLRDVVPGKRLLIGDLKTARSAEPDEFGKASADYGYAISDANYTDAAVALGLDEDPVFLFVVVEKEPPYVVTVGQLDEDSRRIGRFLLRQAIRTFAHCVETDQWPPYNTGVADIALPGWFQNRHQEAFS